MKKERIIFIISLVMMLLATSISVYATSCLYNSSDVSYTAPTGSGLSANVQDSLTEVYGHCTDYTSMDTRVSSLEGHFDSNSQAYFSQNGLVIGVGSTSNQNSYIDFYNNNTILGNIYVGRDSSTGLTIQGNSDLNLNATNVKINGTSLGDLVKAKTVIISCSTLTPGFDLSSYISLDSGYKFLAWETMGASRGWISNFPIYIANTPSTSGGVYWNGTLDTSSGKSVSFTYFEIKNN